jgi:hypothetical protein
MMPRDANIDDASREELNARRRKPNEGILDEGRGAGTAGNHFDAFDLSGLTPELSRAAKRLRLE